MEARGRRVEEHRRRVRDAIALIASVDGYADVARDLAALDDAGRIRYVPRLADRAHAGLTRRVALGPEAIDGGPVGLAETLVHEHWHLFRQHPLHKTASFWAGVATGTPVMARYERPAYRAALAFLDALARRHPETAATAHAEARAVALSFAAEYRLPLG